MNRNFLSRKLVEDPFFRSFVTLLSGSSLGTVIAFLAQLVLVRIYPDTVFGVLDVFIAVVMPLSVIASLSIEDAVFLPERKEDAARVFSTATLLVFVSTIAFFAIIYLFGSKTIALLGVTGLSSWMYWMPPAAAAIALVRLGENGLNRDRYFASISVGRITQSATTSVGQIGAGLPGASYGGLILPYLAGRMATAIYLFWRIRKKMSGLLAWKGISHGFFSVLSTYRRFVYFTTPATLLTSLSAQLPYLLLAFFFTEETVGLFGRGHKLLALPAALIAGAVAKIFMVDAAEAQRAGRLAISVQDVFDRMIAFGFFPTLVAILAGPQIFSFLLGQDWVTAGVFAGYLAPWIFLTVVSSNLTPIFDVTNNQSADFISGLIILSFQAAALYWGSLSGDPVVAVLYLVVAGCLLRILHVTWLFHLSNTPLRQLLVSPAKQSVVSLPGIALVIASQATGLVILVLLAAILGWGTNLYMNARFFPGTNPRS